MQAPAPPSTTTQTPLVSSSNRRPNGICLPSTAKLSHEPESIVSPRSQQSPIQLYQNLEPQSTN
ncbi:unnamed protein product, partial [Rotaria socialis]